MSIEIEKKNEISISENLKLHVENEEEKQTISKDKLVDIYGDLFKLLTSTNEIDNIIKNVLKININDKTKDNINKILLIMTNNNAEFLSPLKNIVESLKEILSDNKIDLHDIPVIIKILTDVFNIQYKNLKNITKKDIALVLKIITISLVELDVIKNDQNQQELIIRLIDSSIALLETTLLVTKCKCPKFLCCN
jgi:hypothetical protein